MTFPFPFYVPATVPPSPPFNPSDLSGLQLWLDASNAGSITISSGSSISQWSDLSGNTNHATQVTTANQPQLQTAALVGLNTIGFSSASQQYFDLTNAINYTNANQTTFLVWRKSGNYIFSLASPSSPLSADWENDNVVYTYDGTANIYVGSTANSDSTNYFNYICIGGGSLANSYVYENGLDVTDRTATGTDVSGNLIYIGRTGARFTDGYIAELAYYNRAVTSSEVVQLKTYARGKWGV